MKRNPGPVRITDAAPSRDDQLRRRRIRYVTMMLFRAVCLILATVLVSAHVPYLVVWVPILLVAILIVPWLAVLLANDRPPKKRRRPSDPVPAEAPASRVLTGSEERVIKTIDADP